MFCTGYVKTTQDFYTALNIFQILILCILIHWRLIYLAFFPSVWLNMFELGISCGHEIL